MKPNNLLILGTLPPPIGGVTVHTLRLIAGLESLGYKYEFIDLRQRNNKDKFELRQYLSNAFKVLKSKDTDIIHYQLNNIFELALFAIIRTIIKSRFITTVHSFRPELFNGAKKIVFNWIKRTSIEFIAPSKTVKEALIASGVKPEKIQILNTFLPPSEDEINADIPNEILKFIEKRNKIIVANAYKLYRDDLGLDVYGLDMCIEACKAIPFSNFIFCVPIINDQDYYLECLKKIDDYQIKDRFLLLNENISLVSLFKYIDLFVRPTSTDSFGISVAEAIGMGIPAIASDVCERAEGSVIFKSRDQYEFNEKIEEYLLKDIIEFSTVKNEDIIQGYIEIYQLRDN